MALRPKYGDPVLVIWKDSFSGDSGWKDKESATVRIIQVHTIGFFVAGSEQGITVAQNIDPADGDFADTTTIPAPCIMELCSVFTGEKLNLQSLYNAKVQL